jgi:hypothetical protein
MLLPALLAGVLTSSCACPSQTKQTALRDPQARPRACRPFEGEGELTSLKELMQRALNPRLSHLTVLLFHDARAKLDDERNDEIARDAQGLADCFALIGPLTPEHQSGQSDFGIYETLGRHNALSLIHAS